MAEERFSEKEVSLVLRRAAEIDAAGSAANAGMTSADIEAIALEAGIPPDAVGRALAEIAGSGDSGRPFLAPASRRTTRKIDGALTRAQMARLMTVVEDYAGRPGTVTEALDTVRWTAQEAGHWTTQVVLSTVDGDTRLAVHERVADSVRRVIHVLPSLWAGIAGIGLTAGGNFNALAAMAVVAGCVGAGFGIGRAVFTWRSRKSEQRVTALADRLEETVRGLVSESEASSAMAAPEPSAADHAPA